MFAAQGTVVNSSKPASQPVKLLLKDGSVRDIRRSLESTTVEGAEKVSGCDASGQR